MLAIKGPHSTDNTLQAVGQLIRKVLKHNQGLLLWAACGVFCSHDNCTWGLSTRDLRSLYQGLEVSLPGIRGLSTRDLRSCWLVWLWIAIWLWACYHCFLYKQLIKTHYIKITTRMQAIVGWAWWSHYKHMTCTIIIITCVSHCTISGYTQSILLYAQHGNWDSGWSRPVIHGVCTCCTLCALQDMSRWHGQRWEHSHHLLSSIATAIEEACPWVTSVLL